MARINQSIEKIKKELDKKSVESLTSNLRTKIQNINKLKDKTILCDVSGSMATYVGNTLESKRAIDVVNDVLKSFIGADIWEFSDNCKRVINSQKLSVKGSTNLGGAFADIKKAKIKEIILLTDGAPDSESHALNKAKGLKINIIYIGPQPHPPFLDELARASGGQFITVELITQGAKAQGEIENKIKGFLNA